MKTSLARPVFLQARHPSPTQRPKRSHEALPLPSVQRQVVQSGPGVVRRSPGPPPEKEKPAFRDCSVDTTLQDNPQNGLIQALDLAQRFVNGAIGKLAVDPESEPKGSSYRVALERHFLSPSKAQRTKILSNFQAIFDKLKGGNVRCAKSDQEQSTCALGASGDIAAFTRDQETVLCFNWWSLNPLCRAQTLIHEAAHAIGLGDGNTHPPYRKGAEYPFGSGEPAKDQTAAARMDNPDAYGYFAAHVWRDIDMECILMSEVIDVRDTKDALPISKEKPADPQLPDSKPSGSK
jgi:hypothetical protein